jgi:tyrosyl-tRNA synthetase
MADLEFEQSQAYSGPSISLDVEQERKYERITKSLQEVTSAEILRKVLSEGRSLVGYWGRSAELEYMDNLIDDL